MKYAPIYSLNRKHVGQYWTEKMLRNFWYKIKKLGIRVGQIIPYTNKRSLNELGKTANEFVSILNDRKACLSPDEWTKNKKIKQSKLQGFKL